MTSRSRKSVTPLKNPHHPSALRVGDLTVGRRITRFNAESGSQGAYRVLEAPRMYTMYFKSFPPKIGMKVKLLCVSNGCVSYPYLSDMGVIPYENGKWNPVNFTIDSHKAHLLPEPLPRPAYRCGYPNEDMVHYEYGKEPMSHYFF